MGIWEKQENVEKLRKLWDKGYSASQIASQINGASRNAIIGKVHRMGLSGRAVVHRTYTPRKKPEKAKPRKKKPAFFDVFGAHYSARGHIAAVAACEHIKPEKGCLEVLSGEIARKQSIADLEPCECRWPVGDGWCAAEKSEHHPSYCEGHAARSRPG